MRSDATRGDVPRSSRPSSALVTGGLPASDESQHSSKPLKSHSAGSRDSAAASGDKNAGVVSATKSVTPRDLLNSASVRGDLFPRLPPNGEAVSSSKRASSHSNSGISVAKHSASVTADSPVGGGSLALSAGYVGESADKVERAARQDLAARQQSQSPAVVFSDKHAPRLVT